ncbi:uncharacterized protein LOC125560950 [Nematostella vectensis]|uniref:uncharacterized protein LOC125560950 n=1 Tax=Nematostella vectensis TaxID=45351 RepID=UPI0020771DE7|nr:uncharacterized protein LOC125560950 [Nematostella vectensis]
MFCSHCGRKLGDDGSTFCVFCGKELSKAVENKPFGRPASHVSTIKSFVGFKKGKDGKPTKKQLKDKNKPEEANDVIINIGLKVFSEGELKDKRGKKLAIKVNKHASYKELLEQAKLKWADFQRNLYSEGTEYVLLYEDGQEALFLPGTSKEFFTLEKYKQAALKDYKRITLYLCTVNDIEEFRKEERDSDSSEPEASCPVKRSNESDACIATEPPAKKLTTNHPTNNHPGPSGISTNSGSDWFYYDEIERLYGNDDSPPPSNNKTKSPIPESEAGVIELLQEKVISDGKISMFMIIRRGTPVTRAITLWQRAAKKVNPVHVCRVKFVGEDVIDDGALAREFFSCIIPDIAKKFFPDGSPAYSTNDIATYRTIGEIVAASLGQGGPAPNFLAPCVFDTLVSLGDLDYSNSKDLQKHLTETECKLLKNIRQDIASSTDIIIDHGYTGPITDACADSILAAVTVSMLSRRELMLKELKKGMELYGLADIVTKHPKKCKGLFVMGHKGKSTGITYFLS